MDNCFSHLAKLAKAQLTSFRKQSSWREELFYAFLWRLIFIILLVIICLAVGRLATIEEQKAQTLVQKYFGPTASLEDQPFEPVENASAIRIRTIMKEIGIQPGGILPWDGGLRVVEKEITCQTDMIKPFTESVQKYAANHRDAFSELVEIINNEIPIFSELFYYEYINYLFGLYTLWIAEQGDYEQALEWCKTGCLLRHPTHKIGDPYFQITMSENDCNFAWLQLKLEGILPEFYISHLFQTNVDCYSTSLERKTNTIIQRAKYRPNELVYAFLDHPFFSQEDNWITRLFGFIGRPYFRYQAALIAQHACVYFSHLEQQLPCSFSSHSLKEFQEPIAKHRLGGFMMGNHVPYFQLTLLNMDKVHAISYVKKILSAENALPDFSMDIPSALCPEGFWRYEYCSENVFAITYMGSPLWDNTPTSIWTTPYIEWTLASQ